MRERSKRFNPITDRSSEIIAFLMASPDMPQDEELRFKIGLSVEEAVENVVHYAYEGGGMPFNPLEIPDPDITLPANEREIGGLGIYLCKKMMDSISYRYEDGNNVLTMTKKLKNER